MGCQVDAKHGSTWFYKSDIYDYKMFSNFKRGDVSLQSGYSWSIIAALEDARANGQMLNESNVHNNGLQKGLDLIVEFGSSTL